MNPFTFVYIELLFRPLFNLLVGITNLAPAQNVGIAIIVVTIIVRLILLPPTIHQAKSMHKNQSKMSELKVSLKKIQKEHKNDPTKKAAATRELYKTAGVNPISGCLPLLIQFPILIALYRVFLIGLTPDSFSNLYSFVATPTALQLTFLGIDLTTSSVLLAIIAGILQYILMRMVTPATPAKPDPDDTAAQTMASMQKNMAYIFPAMTVFFALQFPAALALYWVASTIFGIVQQYYFKRHLKISSGLAV